MKLENIKLLCCPNCRGSLELEIEEIDENNVKNGFLTCKKCGKKYKIENYIARFLD